MLKDEKKSKKKQTDKKLTDEQLEKVSGGMIEIVDDQGNPETVDNGLYAGDHQA